MSHDQLGLFDRPPDRRHIRAGIITVAILFMAYLLILPVSNVRWPEVVAFVPVVNAVMLVGELIIATLLYSQASVFRSNALVLLASGYVFVALLLIPHASTFPGAFAQDGLLGADVNTTAWLAQFRRMAFPAAIILYVVFKRRDVAKPQPVSRIANVYLAASSAVAVAIGATLLATLGHDLLPTLFIDRAYVDSSALLAANWASIAITVVAIGSLLRRGMSVFDLWLLVALSAWLIQSLLNLPLHARFTLGWYGLYLMMMASNLIMLLALVAESNRLYARLAVATAARNRERDARLMSIDAVAAAISHEVGQPLAAITLNASIAKSWLDRPRPNAKKALESLREINDSSQRSFDIIKNIRAAVTRTPNWSEGFSLNELVHGTVDLLQPELAAAKVSLELELEEDLPGVSANEVQIQQVLINLMTNAIESVAATRGRRRRITIRTMRAEDGKVGLAVTDTGLGIAPDNLWRVFETFEAGKPSGTGIGLSLCRTIVEEHGGRIWASAGEKHGATFHVQLPQSA